MLKRATRSKSQFKLNVEIIITKEDQYYVVYCPDLELSSYDETIPKAKASFYEEVSIFLEETHKKGTFEQYLLNNGWTLRQRPKYQYEPPKRSAKNYRGIISRQTINIPVSC